MLGGTSKPFVGKFEKSCFPGILQSLTLKPY